MTYYRKSQRVEAIKWTGEYGEQIKPAPFDWPREVSNKLCAACNLKLKEHGIFMAEKWQTVCPGDWVIIESGEVKVMNEERFRAEYEEVGA